MKCCCVWNRVVTSGRQPLIEDMASRPVHVCSGCPIHGERSDTPECMHHKVADDDVPSTVKAADLPYLYKSLRRSGFLFDAEDFPEELSTPEEFVRQRRSWFKVMAAQSPDQDDMWDVVLRIDGAYTFENDAIQLAGFFAQWIESVVKTVDD